MANDQAEREFSRWNMMIKEQLPLYIEYRVQFIDPVFRALMNFQLRMFSQMLTIYQELSKELGVQPGPIIDRFEKAIEAPREAIMALRIISNPMAIGRYLPHPPQSLGLMELFRTECTNFTRIIY